MDKKMLDLKKMRRPIVVKDDQKVSEMVQDIIR